VVASASTTNWNSEPVDSRVWGLTAFTAATVNTSPSLIVLVAPIPASTRLVTPCVVADACRWYRDVAGAGGELTDGLGHVDLVEAEDARAHRASLELLADHASGLKKPFIPFDQAKRSPQG
jgi:hypothetical protein